ncbi:MAG: type 2 lanthipeptide synthetase LanM [Planctomycetota bacterium]|jgi:type 2 lantibiotic biosynthesis protein LanM|nr:type 2 lanthipeptide synthetase LanM [Planctomycetota bacterium]
MNSESEWQKHFLRIVENALSPDETITHPLRPLDPKMLQEGAQWVDRWNMLIRKKYGSGVFEKRLQHLHLDPTSAAQKFSRRADLNSGPLPDWADHLRRILTEATYPPETAVAEILQSVDPKEELFLAGLLHPFAQSMYRELAAESATDHQAINTNTLPSLVAGLIKRLSQLCLRTLVVQLGRRSALGLLPGDSPEEQYEQYLAEIGRNAEALLHFFEPVPVLARLLAQTTRFAIVNAKTVSRRFRDDREEIENRFFAGTSQGKVSRLETELSDPHNGGQAVWLMEFESGKRLGYKPRSLAIDVFYLRFLDWLHEKQISIDLHAAQVLDRGDYGWVEWLHRRECQSETEVRQFFQRQGANLAVLYHLGGRDFHEDNFIVQGSYPVPIDLEGLFSGGVMMYTDGPIMRDLPLEFRSRNILLTNMLPRWFQSASPSEEIFAVSGICGRWPHNRWPIKQPVIHHLGTSNLRIDYQYLPPKPGSSLPVWEGKEISALDYIEEVDAGFTSTYRAILGHREELFEPQGVLQQDTGLTIRTILRDTNEYGYLLFWVTAPDNLSSGAAHDIALEFLCGGPVSDPEHEHAFAFGNAEKEDLWQRDIPFACAHTHKRSVRMNRGAEHGPINAYSGTEDVQNRIHSMSEEDLEWQRELIKISSRMFYTSPGTASPISSVEPLTGEPDPVTSSQPERPFQKEVLQLLEEFGDQLDHLAARHRFGSSWMTLIYDEKSNSPGFVHPAPWCFQGVSGTQIFLSGLARKTGSDRIADLARSAAQTAFSLTARLLPKYDLECDGLLGLPATLYALLCCSHQFEEARWTEQACTLVRSIQKRRWRSFRSPDLLTGSSAMIALLCELFRQSGDESFLDPARQLAQRVSSQQVKEGEFSGGFRIPGSDNPVVGMAHGPSGIAMALHRLNRLSESDDWDEVIRAGLHFERRLYDPQIEGWHNLWAGRKREEIMNGWCAGGAGIGLARLELETFPDPKIREDLAHAISSTRKRSTADPQHLCCGASGRLIFLSKAAFLENHQEAQQEATVIVQSLLETYRNRGFWTLQNLTSRNLIPGLLDGFSGIGMALLFYLDPQNTPDPLTLSLRD